MADRDGDTVTVISAVKECNRSGMSLLKALRDAGIERDYAYDLLKSAIFEEQLDKPEVFFAYGEDANEFEAALQAVYRELGALAFENEAVEAAAENFLSPVRTASDFAFFLQCRDCFADMQRVLILIERNLWAGTFGVLRQIHGPT